MARNRHKPLTTVDLVSDHPATLGRLANMLSKERGYLVVLQATSARAFMRDFEDRDDVDLVIVDLDVADKGGDTVLKWLDIHSPGTSSAALGSAHVPDRVQRAINSGARCFLLKHATNADLLEVLGTVMRLGYYHSGEVSACLSPADKMHGIPLRAMQFLRWLVYHRDLTYAQIADRMGVTRHAVNGYFRYFSRRFKLHSKAALILFALERKLFPPAAWG